MNRWRQRRDSAIPPLDVPDLGGGSAARERAERKLDEVLASERGSTILQRLLGDIVQENHIRDYLMEAHGRRG